MSTVTQRLLTAEEFRQLADPPNGFQQELVKGVLFIMPPPGGLHGVCCSKVGRKVGAFVDERNLGTVATNDTGFYTERNPDTIRGADVAFWSRERLLEIPLGYIEIAPDLAVEVLSPSNTFKQIQEKLLEYFAVNVRLVWVVAPEDRTVAVYRNPDEGRLLHENAVLTGEDVLPGFSCRVGELFP